MKPKLKAQDCLDHDPIEKWQPADPTNVDYQLCLHIGPDGEPGADLFYVNVLSEAAARETPAALLARRKHIIIYPYSWSAVVCAVDSILQQIDGGDWDEVARKLAKKFAWEFDNYQPYEQRA